MYHVFAGSKYYPCGGVKDFQGTRDSLESALILVAELDCDWWHIVNNEFTIVKNGKRNYD